MSPQDGQKPAAGSLRELLRVAVPLAFSSGSLSLMHVIDRTFLTWSSTEALAASLPAGIMHWTVMSVLIGTVSYVNTFVAQYSGAGQKDRAAAAVWQGIYLSLAAGVAFLVFVPLAGPMFELIGHKEALRPLEAQFFAILCVGAVPIALSHTLSCFYSGRGETRVVMCVNFLIAAVNIVFGCFLIFGAGPVPAMGIAGAAWATNIAYTVGALAYLALMTRSRESNEYGIWRNRAFEKELFGRMMRYGLPTGLQYLADGAGFALFIMLVGLLGAEQLAATNLAFSLNALAFVPTLGVGIAVMTLVGKRIGEGRPELAVRTTWMAFALASSYTLFFAGVYLLLPDLILYPYASFHKNPQEFAALREITVVLLRFVALYSFFDGMAVVFGFAVRGAGDTRFSLIFTLAGAWTIMVLPTWLGWSTGGGTLTTAWWACCTYIIVNGVGFLLRFQTGRWKSMRVIEDFSPDASLSAAATPAPELVATKVES